MRAFVTLLSSAVVATALAVAPAAATTTPAPVQLPVSALGDWVVDVPHGHLYLTGTGTAGLYVRDLAGNAVSTLYAGQGARGLTLSADGSTLYVALTGGHAIAAVDTTTLAETGRWATGATTCPNAVAEQGTQLWFLYGCTNQGNLGVVERAGDAPAVTLALSPVQIAPTTSDLLAAPESRLVVHDDGYDKIFVLALDGTTATKAAERDFEAISDFALTPAGTELMVAAHNAPHSHGVYTLPDLAVARGYGTAMYPAAITAAGGYVATTVDLWTEKDITVWTAEGAQVRTFELPKCCSDPSTPPTVVRRGTAFSPDASTLYVLSQSGYAHALWLHVLPDANKGVSTITLTKPAGAKIRVAYTVTGRLNPGLAGQPVTITRVSTYGTVALPPVTTGADGAFSITDTVRKRGSYTYKAAWAGDAQNGAALGQTTLKVLGLTPSLSLATSASSYKYGATASALARLGTTYTNRAVAITATPYGYSKRTLKNAAVDGSGYLRASTTVSRKTTFAATFAGDAVYEPRTVTKTVTVGVLLKQYMSRHYTKSGSYHVYRRTVDPAFHVQVSPNRMGTCMAFAAQHYTGGAWRTLATEGCLPLDQYSLQSAVLTGTHTVGVNYRIRSTFVGDVSNARTTGGWLYLRFTN